MIFGNDWPTTALECAAMKEVKYFGSLLKNLVRQKSIEKVEEKPEK
jgi:hypothetical protein